MQDHLRGQVRRWQQSLLDLTNRNRLLSFTHTVNRPQTLALKPESLTTMFETLAQGTALTIIGETAPTAAMDDDVGDEVGAEEIDASLLLAPVGTPPAGPTSAEAGPAPVPLAPARRVALPKDSVLSTFDGEKTTRVLVRLLQKARDSELELGVGTLYAVFGRLRWNEYTPDIRATRAGVAPEASRREPKWRFAPLVLVPIDIDRTGAPVRYRIRSSGEDPEFNQTLIEKLRFDYGINLSVTIDEETTLDAIFATVRDAVRDLPGWDVVEDVHLGILQFYKIRMFHDLDEHVEIAVAHPIIQAMANPGLSLASGDDGPAPELLDHIVRPEESYSFLDADSSQLRAVEMAKGGSHLIVHGPPGTGKSQTIANVIAEALGDGKTVLFVSEKAAAIEVVYRRLHAHGLSNYCLMLHSHARANKREVIDALASRMQATAANPLSAQETHDNQQLVATRSHLNAYANLLHQPGGPLERTPFRIIGELAARKDLPPLASPLPRPAAVVDYDTLNAWRETIENLRQYDAIIATGDSFFWAFLRPTALTLAERNRLQAGLQAIATLASEVRQAGSQLAGTLGLPPPASLADAHRLVQLATNVPEGDILPATWLDATAQGRLRTLLPEAVERASTLAQLQATVRKTYDDAVFPLATADAIALYQKSALGRLVSGQFRATRAAVRAAARDGQQRPPDVERDYLQQASDARGHRAWFVAQHSSLTQFLGTAPPPADSPNSWRDLQFRTNQANTVLSIIQGAAEADTARQRLTDADTRDSVRTQRPGFVALVEGLDREWSNLAPLFAREPQAGAAVVRGAAFGVMAEWAGSGLSRLGDVDTWARSRTALAAAAQLNLTGSLDEMRRQGIDSGRWFPTLEKHLYTELYDALQHSAQPLFALSREQHDAAIARFRELDRASLRRATQRTRRQLQVDQSRSAMDIGERGILLKEISKKRRHKPLRILFSEIPNLIQELKPCLMMSPLSVAQYLPAHLYEFDLVIFDEASQVRPYDAIGAIMRGKQLIVAGDDKQLPPTSFFDRDTDEEQAEDALSQLESILDALRAKDMPSSDLRWHYRSRDEGLIAFSNSRIYGDRLVTFPSPRFATTGGRAVRLDYLPQGRYAPRATATSRTGASRGFLSASPTRTNVPEATHVAALVMEHAGQHPGKSLGVVALSLPQAEEIQEEVKAARTQRPEFEQFFSENRDEPFFIKPLELVQGDERDRIIISIGYGWLDPTDKSRPLPMRFGPINRQGGERRLNVLVTRARDQVVVVSSIRAGDFGLTGTNSVGVRLLKTYLDYAERGPIALEAETKGGDGDYESPFEEAVGTKLEHLGYTVHRQVGVSRFRIDLAIVDPAQPGRFLLGIECDGATYHSSKTARDRDRLRQEILEGMGWHIHRIWSTEWARDEHAELDRVLARLDAVQQAAALEEMPERAQPMAEVTAGGASSENPEPPIALFEMPEPPPVSVTAAVPTAAPYLRAHLRVTPGSAILLVPAAVIADKIRECVDIESPVHRELVSRRVSDAWGIKRRGTNIEQAIAAAMSQTIRSGQVVLDGQFLWAPSKAPPVPRGRAADGTTRDIEHIAPAEILAGVQAILDYAHSLPLDELVAQTARYFEYRRTGQDIKDAMRTVILAAQDDGTLTRQGERYRVS